MPGWLTDLRLLALAIVVSALLGAWMFRYEALGPQVTDEGIRLLHRNRVTGAVCVLVRECWWR